MTENRRLQERATTNRDTSFYLFHFHFHSFAHFLQFKLVSMWSQGGLVIERDAALRETVQRVKKRRQAEDHRRREEQLRHREELVHDRELKRPPARPSSSFNGFIGI